MYNIIPAEVPKEKLGFMMGIGTMITTCAVAFGPVVGGVVTDALNWCWIFIISLFLIVISLLTGIYSIRQINLLQKVKIK
jgi:DHA2 family lincomycin resistance protein-like MFS transporter